MRCRKFRKETWKYLEGPAGERAAAHLKDCPACRRELDRTGKLLKLLRTARAPQPSPEYFSDFWPRLRGKLAPRRPALLHPLYYGGLAAAAAALVLWVSLDGDTLRGNTGPDISVYALATPSSPIEGGPPGVSYISGPARPDGVRARPEIDYVLPRIAARESRRLEV